MEVANSAIMEVGNLPFSIQVATASSRATSDSLRALTVAMVRGEEAAYIEFHKDYFDRLFRYLLVVHRGSEHEAKEALQLTLVRVVRHIKVFDDPEGFWRWLTRLARSCSADENRRRFRYFSFLNRFASDASTHELGSDDDPLARVTRQQFELLPAEERDLIDRKYFAEQSVKEIAGDLQTSEKAVESRLTRARHKLKSAVLVALKNE